MNLPATATKVGIGDEVTDNQLSRYATLIYEVTGIRISPQKKALLSNRVRRRLRATGIANFEAYLKHLKSLDVGDEEWDHFLQEITTHETYLFRDEMHWDWFQNTYLPDLVQSARTGGRQRTLRIWSAACSTGDEAYTAAACIVAKLPNYSQWSIKIVGTDIGSGAVAKARAPHFGQRAMRLVPNDIQKRCFVEQDGNWIPKPELSRLCEFHRHNLLEPLKQPAFDLVLLKNVLIYFDSDSKKVVVENMRRALRPGNLLVAGAAEGISDLLGDFERLEPWLYRLR